MKAGIMQPYFLPYIGYWQLMNAVDVFFVYDNIQYSKEGWVNRNRILLNGSASLFSLPLKKDSDYLNIVDRKLADSFSSEKLRLFRKIESAYRKAPFFKEVMPIVSNCLDGNEENLFRLIYKSIQAIRKYMRIKTPVIISSCVGINHSLKAADKVIALCRTENADEYINPIGGLGLYDKADFAKAGIDLKFIKTGAISYKQYDNQFVPDLSVIDVLMFNSRDAITEMLENYELR